MLKSSTHAHSLLDADDMNKTYLLISKKYFTPKSVAEYYKNIHGPYKTQADRLQFADRKLRTLGLQVHGEFMLLQ